MPESSKNPVIKGEWLTRSQRQRPTAASNEVLEHSWHKHQRQCESPPTGEWPEVQRCPIDGCAIIFVCNGCGHVIAIGLSEIWCDFVEAERVHQFGP